MLREKIDEAREPPTADTRELARESSSSDEVIEASEESFPASDPPAWVPMRRFGPPYNPPERRR